LSAIAEVWSLILTEPVVFSFWIVVRYNTSHEYICCFRRFPVHDSWFDCL